jgi:hypothetical protein
VIRLVPSIVCVVAMPRVFGAHAGAPPGLYSTRPYTYTSAV